MRRAATTPRRGVLRRMLDWFYIEEAVDEDEGEQGPAGGYAPEGGGPGEGEWPAAGPAPSLGGEAPYGYAGEDDGSPYFEQEPRHRRPGSVVAWTVAVLALAVVGGVIAKGLLHHAAPAVQLTATATATATASAPATPTVTAAQHAASVREAERAAANASRSASSAETAARRVDTLLTSAQKDARSVKAAANVELARKPSAKDPSSTLGPLQRAAAAAGQDVNAIESDATAADGAANAAASIAESTPAAAASGNAAASAAARANQAVSSAQQVQGKIQALLASARAAVAAWKHVHAAPRGVLGVTVEDPAPNLGVQGCEVVTAKPDSPAVAAGLVGATQSFDRVGDVITDLTDGTYANTTWTVTGCAALTEAMKQTRVGDHVTITYLRSRNLLFTTQWVRASGKAVLGSGAKPPAGSATATATASGTAGTRTATGTATATPSGTATSTASVTPSGTATGTATATGNPATGTATATASCPAPISGTITPVTTGSRIELPITLSGPGGTAPNLRAILDTGGVATTFPDGLLRQLGYHPYSTTENSGVVPGATAVAYLYHVPGSAITTLDGGRQVALATGVLDVIGIPGGSNYTLGPDILEGGSRLSTSGDQWSLTPPC